MAKLYFRYGAMNSGKTETILNVIYNYETERHLNILLLKPELDNKGEDCIVGRSGKKRKVDFLIGKDGLNEAIKHIKMTQHMGEKISAIIVDESQFLTHKDIMQLSHIVNILNIPVLAYGLRVDSNSKPFEGSSSLFALANIVEPITIRTVCSKYDCEHIATRHLLYVNDELQYNGDSDEASIVIDSSDKVKYSPVCSKCWHTIVENYDKHSSFYNNCTYK